MFQEEEKMLQLTPLEDYALRGIRCACRAGFFLDPDKATLHRPLVVQISIWMVLVCIVVWVVKRILGYEDNALPSAPTLYDPKKLHDTLTYFALPPRHGTQTKHERHRTEALCRELLESMLAMPLPKVRPKWLTNPTTKRALELDMYNQEHRIAFEYDGAQHDVYTPHYHANEHHFQYRKLLDRLKTELCREAKVMLIRIPWSEVSCQDEVRTARFLERLLYTHHLPYKSVLIPVSGPPGPS